jgi:hypothetical protein
MKSVGSNVQVATAIHDEGDGLICSERHSQAYDHTSFLCLYWLGWNYDRTFVSLPNMFFVCSFSWNHIDIVKIWMLHLDGGSQ